MKKLAFTCLTALAVLCAVSCQKEKTDTSSPIGRQWLLPPEAGMVWTLLDFGKSILVEKEIQESNLGLKALPYEDCEKFTVKSIQKVTADWTDGPIWEIVVQNEFWGGERDFYIYDVTAEGAKMKHVFSPDPDYEYELKAVPSKIKLTYRYVPYSAYDLGLSVYWASFDLKEILPEDFDPYNRHYTVVYSEDAGDYMAWQELEDPVHGRLGGKWRMPTREECQELFANCTCSEMAGLYHIVSTIPGYELQDIEFKSSGYLEGSNTRMKDYSLFWTATPSEQKNHAYAARLLDNGAMDFLDLDQACRLLIRPVWDPKMP